MNAIKHAIQPRIQKHFNLSKTSFNKKNDKHRDPKHTHTHTTNLTNFIFQKQVKTV